MLIGWQELYTLKDCHNKISVNNIIYLLKKNVQNLHSTASISIENKAQDLYVMKNSMIEQLV